MKTTNLKCRLLLVLVTISSYGFSQSLLTLETAIKEGLQNNFDLQVIKNDLQIAEIQNNWGNAGRLPFVAANMGYTYTNGNLHQALNSGVKIDRNGTSLQQRNSSLSAQWNIFNGFRVIAAKKRLETVEDISNLAVKQQANLTVYNVIISYLTLMRLKLERQALQETMLLFKERMTLAENRFNIGVAGKSDWLQAQVDYNQQENNLLQNELDTKTAITILNNLMVHNPDDVFSVSDTIARVNLPLRSEIIASIDTLNPQLMIAKKNQVVLMEQQKEINAQRLPTLAMTAGANYNSNKNSEGLLLLNTTYGPNAGLQLSIPIYSAGLVKQQLHVNSVQQKTQQVYYDKLRNDLQTTLANAYNSVENARQKYELELKTLEIVKENNFIAMERFRKGSITTVELRQTQLNYIESEARLIRAMYQSKQAEADILLIMGKLVD